MIGKNRHPSRLIAPDAFIRPREASSMVEVLVEDRGSVRWVMLNRPERLNAIDLPTAEAWRVELGQASLDPSVRAVVLAGAGKAFCSGGDLRAFREAEDREGYLASVASEMGQGVTHICLMDKPVIAAVHGSAMGVGFSMFLAADLKLVAEGTRLALSYVNVGLTPGGGATWMLPRLVGFSRASELLLLGEAITADMALEIGIVNRVVPRAELEAEAQALAERLATGASGAIAGTKSLIHEGLPGSFEEHLRLEAETIGKAAATDEFEEGSAAFFERRRPDVDGGGKK